jgi:hypothetical protein
MDDDTLAPEIVRTTAHRTAFPVLCPGGFGQIVVTLEPGQSETVLINGRLITVIREQLH